ncbi:MAG: cadmium-translocating P-type ATPase [Planctomycetaceae bacterium]|nr:cadmium-translocating P-type ATPase [Planctomycetaceae bacterium]
MNSEFESLEFKIHGMDCAEEVAVLKRELGPRVGGEERLAFDILNGKLIVEAVTELSSEDVIQAVARTGMRAEVWQEGVDRQVDAGFWQRHGRSVLTAVSGLSGVAGFLTHVWLVGGFADALGSEGTGGADGVPILPNIFYAIGITTGVWYVLPKAWSSAISLRPDMNLLMTIAVIGAASIGEWFEAVTVAFLFSVSLLLESWSVDRARRAIAALMDLTPPMARVRDEAGIEKEVPPDQVAVGATFIVRPAEKIPLDGKVIRGGSDVNQAPITGESVPVPKSEGSEVFAGTINGDGVLEVECTKPAGDTTLAHIIRMVGEAQSRRAPSEKWVEKFARVYTPVVMALAAAILIAPPLLFGGAWLDWLYRSLVLLVIACPCALVISTPVSVVAALSAAARNGVLIKGGVFIEAPAHLQAIAMDKTGTLTEGKPALVDIVPMSGHDETELLQRAAALESHSNHPLAQAIVAAANERGVKIPAADEFEIIQGKGATGRIDGKLYWLGSHRYLEERNQETPSIHEQLESMQQAGRTVVVVGNESHVCGFITLADTLRPTAAETLRQLRAAGVKHLVMLTGDNQGTAQAIATEAGIDEVHAELLPEDKVNAVESLVDKYGQVAMVGDGVNDAPALGRATLGIAMGAAGSDAAIETADIALMSDDLSKLPWLIHHSRRALAIIRQNITFSLFVKALFVVLTFAGYASLWAAIAADMGASMLVIFNGLRLLQARRS